MNRSLFFIGFLIVLLISSSFHPLAHASSLETLRPDAIGDKSFLHPVPVVDHYLDVDETPSDDDTSYVATDTNDQLPETDLYNLPNSAIGAGDTINSVTVYMNVRSQSNTYKAAWRTTMKTYGTEFLGTLVNPTTTYTEYSTEYLVNPNTTSAWTLDEINALQIGVNGYSGKRVATGAIYIGLCTQVWCVINFTVAAGGAYNFSGTATLTFATTQSKTVSFTRQGVATFTFATVGTYSKTSLLNLVGSAILSFTSGMSEALGFNRCGMVTLTFVSNMQKTMQFNRHGEAVLTFTSIGEYWGGVFLKLFGSALLSFTSEALKALDFCRYGASTLTFTTVSEKLVSFTWYGVSSLTFLAESLRSIARTLTFEGSVNLCFLSEQLRTFTFNRYGTAPLSFNVESIVQGLGAVLTFFGSASFMFTVQKTVIMLGETLQNAKIFVAATFIMAILIGIPILVLIMSRKRS